MSQSDDTAATGLGYILSYLIDLISVWVAMAEASRGDVRARFSESLVSYHLPLLEAKYPMMDNVRVDRWATGSACTY